MECHWLYGVTHVAMQCVERAQAKPIIRVIKSRAKSKLRNSWFLRYDIQYVNPATHFYSTIFFKCIPIYFNKFYLLLYNLIDRI